MDEWNEEFLGFEVERELEKHRAEQESLTTDATGAKSKIGCGAILLYFILGILAVRIFAEVVSIFSR